MTDEHICGGPLWNAVHAYTESELARFHMPGHKGRGESPFSALYAYDITEVSGADSLYEADGAIRALEDRFALLYGAKRTLVSAGGATLCIQTMLALVATQGGVVVAGRGVHTSAINAMALLDLTPTWVLPEGGTGFGMGGRVSPQAIHAALCKNEGVCCVYITSPDYFGVLSDIAGIAAVCRRHNVPLLVDNAHGSHLKWHEGGSRHPIDLGASMCCDSPHKTLPVLTGGALLHIADERFVPNAKRCMALFGSTSPSYLIMLSLDHCLTLLEHGYGNGFYTVRKRMRTLATLAIERGFVPLVGECDATKLTLSVWNWACTPAEFADTLRIAGIEPEYSGEAWAVLMASPENSDDDYARVQRFLAGWCATQSNAVAPELPPLPIRDMSLREATFTPCERIATEHSAHRTACTTVCPCPPGIPIVTPGEHINAQAAALLKRCGISFINVVK